MIDHAGVPDEVNESRRASVQNRHLRSVELDENVVNTHPGKYSQKVLDSLHLGSAVGEGGRQASVRNIPVSGLDTRMSLDIEPLEYHTRTGGKRMNRHVDDHAGVQTHPVTAY